jgi:hypothetical protein
LPWTRWTDRSGTAGDFLTLFGSSKTYDRSCHWILNFTIVPFVHAAFWIASQIFVNGTSETQGEFSVVHFLMGANVSQCVSVGVSAPLADPRAGFPID